MECAEGTGAVEGPGVTDPGLADARFRGVFLKCVACVSLIPDELHIMPEGSAVIVPPRALVELADYEQAGVREYLVRALDPDFVPPIGWSRAFEP